MRPLIMDFTEIAVNTIPSLEPVYEFGSFQVPGQEGIADLRKYFQGKEFVGCDMREGLGVDKVINLHNIDLPDESVGTVVTLDTLEHVEYPNKAMDEVYRILKPGGMAIIASVMNFHIHDYPHDYWRFTPEAFRSLLKPFSSSFVGSAGRKDFPHTVVGIGFKDYEPNLDEFMIKYNEWEKSQNSSKLSFKNIRRLLMPAIFSRKCRRALIE